MSGHSKWAQIKRQKAVTDKKKGQIFSKLAKGITLAARQGGDPSINYKLRLEIERAKDIDMPSANIDRAIKRGGGEGRAGSVNEVIYEGYGPGGTAFLVQAATDNRNRTTNNIRHIFSKHGGNLGNQGSAAYLFKPKGQILILKTVNMDVDDLTLRAIDEGVDDVKASSEGLEIYTAPANVEKLNIFFTQIGAPVASCQIIMQPTSNITLDEINIKTVTALLNDLENDEDVVTVATNADV